MAEWRQGTERMGEIVRANGGEILDSARVMKIVSGGDGMVVESTAGDVEAKLVVTCAGLYSDRVTRLSGQKPPARIVPFRGEYFELKPEAHHLCRTLIYPVPDPSFPFLGVHFTRTIHVGLECGPNAVLSFAR